MEEHSHKHDTGKYILFSFFAFLLVLNILPIAAPLLMHFGFKKPANIIYWMYSFVCHQKAHRSYFIYDEQCAWCMRDTFIWAAMLFALLYVIKSKNNAGVGISWKLALLLIIPMALDGSTQLVGTISSLFTRSTPFYESTNTIRALTGSLFGTAIGLFMFPRVKKELLPDEKI
jgi:uncharacterized membrane protein